MPDTFFTLWLLRLNSIGQVTLCNFLIIQVIETTNFHRHGKELPTFISYATVDVIEVRGFPVSAILDTLKRLCDIKNMT